MRLGLVSTCFLGAFVSACGFGGELNGTPGESGNGVFSYECGLSGAGDAVCNVTESVDLQQVGSELGSGGELPVAVAVGARFDLHYFGNYVTDDGEVLVVGLEAAQSDSVHQKGGFSMRSEGRHAFLARSAKGFVADFVHMEAAIGSELDVWKDEQLTHSIELEVATATSLAVVPKSRDNLALAGALPFEWTSSDEKIITIGNTHGEMSTTGIEINDDEVRLLGVAAGTATVTVKAGSLQKTITVTVTPKAK